MKKKIKRFFEYFKKNIQNDPKEYQIVWNGDLTSAKLMKEFLQDTGYVYQILDGDTKWDEKKEKKVLYTEPFLLYIDSLGGYIETGTVIFKNFKIINNKEIIVLSSKNKYNGFSCYLEKKI